MARAGSLITTSWTCSSRQPPCRHPPGKPCTHRARQRNPRRVGRPTSSRNEASPDTAKDRERNRGLARRHRARAGDTPALPRPPRARERKRRSTSQRAVSLRLRLRDTARRIEDGHRISPSPSKAAGAPATHRPASASPHEHQRDNEPAPHHPRQHSRGQLDGKQQQRKPAVDGNDNGLSLVDCVRDRIDAADEHPHEPHNDNQSSSIRSGRHARTRTLTGLMTSTRKRTQ